MVHQLKACDKAGGKIVAKCGHETKFPKDGVLPPEFTAWGSLVECKECLGV